MRFFKNFILLKTLYKKYNLKACPCLFYPISFLHILILQWIFLPLIICFSIMLCCFAFCYKAMDTGNTEWKIYYLKDCQCLLFYSKSIQINEIFPRFDFAMDFPTMNYSFSIVKVSWFASVIVALITSCEMGLFAHIPF